MAAVGMSRPKFKVGDRVYIVKSDRSRSFDSIWAPNMDKYVHTWGMVTRVETNVEVKVGDGSYWWFYKEDLRTEGEDLYAWHDSYLTGTCSTTGATSTSTLTAESLQRTLDSLSKDVAHSHMYDAMGYWLGGKSKKLKRKKSIMDSVRELLKSSKLKLYEKHDVLDCDGELSLGNSIVQSVLFKVLEDNGLLDAVKDYDKKLEKENK